MRHLDNGPLGDIRRPLSRPGLGQRRTHAQEAHVLVDDADHGGARRRIAGHDLVPQSTLQRVESGDLDGAQEVDALG